MPNENSGAFSVLTVIWHYGGVGISLETSLTTN